MHFYEALATQLTMYGAETNWLGGWQHGPDDGESCCRDGFLEALRGGHTVTAAAAVRVVWALIHSRAVDPEILDSGGQPCFNTCALKFWAQFGLMQPA